MAGLLAVILEIILQLHTRATAVTVSEHTQVFHKVQTQFKDVGQTKSIQPCQLLLYWAVLCHSDASSVTG